MAPAVTAAPDLLMASASVPATPAKAGTETVPLFVVAQASHGDRAARSVKSTFDVNFDRWDNGPCTSDHASTDFGDATGWDADNTITSGGRLRATLEPNKIGGDGGTLSSVDLSDGTEYEMHYTVNFHSQFDWSRGGKIGLGFAFGDGAGGCRNANSDSASLRLIWYIDDRGRT